MTGFCITAENGAAKIRIMSAQGIFIRPAVKMVIAFMADDKTGEEFRRTVSEYSFG